MPRARHIKLPKTIRPSKRELNAISGVEQLHKTIDQINDDVSKKDAAKVVRSVAANIAKAMRTEVTKSNASADLKRAARRAIKQRMKKAFGSKRGSSKEAKVGFGVGKPAEANRSGHNRGGVGVSSKNIHWFVLGTGERATNTGHATGRVQAVFAGLASKAVGGARLSALQKATDIYKKTFDRARKRR